MSKENYFHSLLQYVKNVVYTILRKENLLQGEWHLGKVESVINPKRLKVFVDGSETAITVPCNPDVNFQPGDEIFVIFINRDSKNKYALCKRAIL